MVDFEKTPMTKDLAEYIRMLRVDMGCSYRKVAGVVAEICPGMNIKTHQPFNGQVVVQPGGYQSEGMDLCAEAAEFFGENAGDEPWN